MVPHSGASHRSTLRSFGREPLDPELAAEGLKAERLSTGSFAMTFINSSPLNATWYETPITTKKEVSYERTIHANRCSFKKYLKRDHG